MIKLRVYGVPVPQGSMRAFATRRGGQFTGDVVVTADNKGLKTWRQAVVDEARQRYPALVGQDQVDPAAVRLVFIMPRPRGHYGSGRNAAQLRPSAPRWHTTTPDLDKLCRSTLDALTAAGLWRDDALVATIHATKTYAGPGEQPGAEIEVRYG